jgi:hypothetical protein
LPCFAVAAVYSGEQNGLHQMYYFRALSAEIIYTISQFFFLDKGRMYKCHARLIKKWYHEAGAQKMEEIRAQMAAMEAPRHPSYVIRIGGYFEH